MQEQTQTQKQWAIFYTTPSGKTYGCTTHLGCCQLSDDTVNIYCDEKKLQEIYKQTIAYVHRTEQAPKDSGHAYWEGWLKPDYRNGKVFIARVGSKDFPATITGPIRFQDDGYTKDKVWALRVPCEIKTN